MVERNLGTYKSIGFLAIRKVNMLFEPSMWQKCGEYYSIQKFWLEFLIC